MEVMILRKVKTKMQNTTYTQNNPGKKAASKIKKIASVASILTIFKQKLNSVKESAYGI